MPRSLSPLFSSRKRLIVVAISACFVVEPAWSNPSSPAVVSGNASFSNIGNTLNVTNSNGAIINWNTFSIGAGESTRFIQPSASSAVLNRVLANDPSVILGNLSSNGRVWLVNPAGIMVGAGARIDVAGFVASTLNVRNEDFLAGRLSFQATPNAGAIDNRGQITTPSGGSVYLIAPKVENSGAITAPTGEIVLAAGQKVELFDTGTPGIKVEITGTQGSATNLGTLAAEAGRIGMGGVLVRNSGKINASSVVSEGGRVFLRASKDAYVEGSGQIVATGTRGGSVEVLGNRVAVTDSASIDVSGSSGGGQILIGGDYQGRNADVQNAAVSYVGPNAGLKADALQSGDGGKVIVWSDDTTRVYGSLSAKGGAQSGIGGLVETSGHGHLDVARIKVDTSSLNGATGSWLLDPTNVTIAAGSGAATFTGGIFDNGGGVTSTVYDADINANLMNGSVTITTASNADAAGDITVNSDAAILNAAGAARSLTLRADRGIFMNPGASISGRIGSPLNVTLNANAGGTGAGSIAVGTGSSIVTFGGNVSLAGGVNGTGYATGTVSNPVGIDLDGATIDAGMGNITMRGTGVAGTDHAHGIRFANGSAIRTSGAGAINLSGIGGAGTNTNRGVYIDGTGTTVSSLDGSISITGQGAGTGDDNRGVYVSGGATVSATGAAGVSLDGTGSATGTDYNYGVYIKNPGTAISSTAGAITINGHGAGTGSDNYGIHIYDGAKVASAGSGTITLSGMGGAGTDTNRGVYLDSAGTAVTSVNGNISITGLGAGSSYDNRGIYVSGGATVSGTGSAGITLNGTGSAVGTDENYGVYIKNPGTSVSTVNGAITITGHGGGSAGDNHGIYVHDGAVVHSTSGSVTLSGTGGSKGWGVVIDGGAAITAANAGSIAISGTGTNDYTGVYIENSNTRVTTQDGNIQIDGVGGPEGSRGVYLLDGAAITATNSGSIAITGKGSADNSAVKIVDAGTIVSTHSGNLTLDGMGNRSDGGNGVYIADDAVVQTTGGAIRILGQGGIYDGSANSGVNIEYGAQVRALGPTGSIFISGTGGAYGVHLNDGAVVQTDSGFLRIVGVGGPDNSGVDIETENTLVTTRNGALSIDGTAGLGDRDPTYNRGVKIHDYAQVTATGSGSISIIGHGSVSSASDNYGVNIYDSATVRTLNGDISITGYGGGAGTDTSNQGVLIENSLLESIGTGNITIVGTAGNGTDHNSGVILDGATLRTANGSISIRGYGSTGSAGYDNMGIGILNESVIEANGSGSITLEGHGGTGTDWNSGIDVWSGPNVIRTQSGMINISGYGGTVATGESNMGVWLEDGTTVESTTGGNLNILGRGGSGTRFNSGVYIEGDSQVRANGGAIDITGFGGATSAEVNVGVRIEGYYDNDRNDDYVLLRPLIEAAGSGNLRITGTGGSGTFENSGVEITAASVRARDGLLSITGHGGPGAEYSNRGVVLRTFTDCECSGETEYAVVESMGKGAIAITGTAVVPSNLQNNYDNSAVVLEQYSSVRSAGGAITIAGTGTGALNVSGTESPAVLINGSIMAGTTHGSGTVSISGTISSGSHGVSMESDGAIYAAGRDVILAASSGGIHVAGAVHAANLTIAAPLTLTNDPVFKVQGAAQFGNVLGDDGSGLGLVAGSINVGNISTAIANGGSSGAISLTATDGSIIAGALSTRLTNPASNGATSGSISVNALDGVTTGAIDTSVSGIGADAGNAGAVSLLAQRGGITAGDVNAYAKGSGIDRSAARGGDIYFKAGGGISVGAIDTSSEAAAGQSGATGNAIQASGGGNISLLASGGGVTTGNINTRSRVAAGSSTSSAGPAGSIVLRGADNVLVNGSINASSTNAFGDSGQGGRVSLYALGGNLAVSGNVDSGSQAGASSGSAVGGDIILYANGTAGNGGTINTLGSSTNGELFRRDTSNAYQGDLVVDGLSGSYFSGDTRIGYALPGGDVIINATGKITFSTDIPSTLGNVILDAKGGGITANNFIGTTGGFVSMRAAGGDINLAYKSGQGMPLDSSISRDLVTSGGDILLRAIGAGSRIVGQADLYAAGDSNHLNGGTVRLIADGNVQYQGNISASGYGYYSGQKADGGSILVQSRFGSIDFTGVKIEANGGGYGGNGGNIEITLGNAYGAGVLTVPGAGGSIALGNGDNSFPSIYAFAASGGNGSDGGKGGNVRISTALASTGGNITHYGTINAGGGDGSGSGSSANAGGRGGAGGSVVIAAGIGGRATLSSILASGGDGGEGNYNYGNTISFDSRGGDGGRGGRIAVSAPGTVSLIDIYANGGDSGPGRPNGNSGDGGVIAVTSSIGDINVTGGIRAYGGNTRDNNSWGGDGGKGGTLTLNAGGRVSIDGLIDVRGGYGGDGGNDYYNYYYGYDNYGEPTRGGNGGNGGTVGIEARGGSESETTLWSVYAGGGSGGDGFRAGNYSTNTTPGGDGGKGGAIDVSVPNGSLAVTGEIYASGGSAGGGRSGGNSGDGGAVKLGSGGLLTAMGTIDVSGGYAPYSTQGGDGGKGGTVDIRSTAASVVINSSIVANGGDGGEGGSNNNDWNAPNIAGGSGGSGGMVTIVAQDSVSLMAPISARGRAGGEAFWDSNANAYTSPGGAGGNGGMVALTATAGELTVTNDVELQGGNGGAGLPSGKAGDGGSVKLVSGVLLTVDGYIYAGGGNVYQYDGSQGGRGGKGGKVEIGSAAGNISINASIHADGGEGGYSGNGGNGGTIEIVSTTGSVSIDASIYAGGGQGASAGSSYNGATNRLVSGGKGGDGGTVTIGAGNSVSVTGSIYASGGDGGNGFWDYDSNLEVSPGGDGGTGGSVTLRSTGSAGVVTAPGSINVSGGWWGSGANGANGANTGRGGNSGDFTVRSAGNIALGSIHGDGGEGGGNGGTILVESTFGSISINQISANANAGPGYTPNDVFTGPGLDGSHGGDVTLRVTQPQSDIPTYITTGSIRAQGASGGNTGDSSAAGGTGGNGGTVRFEFGTLANPGNTGGSVSLGYSYLNAGSGGYNGNDQSALSGNPGSVTMIAHGGDLTVGRSSNPDALASSFAGVTTDQMLNLQAPNGKVLSGSGGNQLFSNSDVWPYYYTDATAPDIRISAGSGIGAAAAALKVGGGHLRGNYFDSLHFANTSGDVFIASDNAMHVDQGASGGNLLLRAPEISFNRDVGNIAASGNVTYVADALSLVGSGSFGKTSSGGGTGNYVQLKPYSLTYIGELPTARDIRLTTAGAEQESYAALNVDEQFLARVTTPVLRLGDRNDQLVGNVAVFKGAYGESRFTLPATVSRLSLETPVSVTQDASLTMPGALAANAGGNVTLADSGNQIGGRIDISASSSGVVSLNNAAALTTLGDISGAGFSSYAAGDVSLLGAISGNSVEIRAAGRIAEGSTGSIDATGVLTTQSVGGTVLTGTNHLGSFTADNSGGGNIELRNASGHLVLGNVASSGGVTIAGTGGDVLVAGNVQAGTSVNISAIGIANYSSITGLAGVSLDAGTGAFANGSDLHSHGVVSNGSGTGTIKVNAASVDLQAGGANGNSNIIANNGGRWLVYSTNPGNVNSGAMAYDFREYNKAFGSDPTPLTGNGFLYSIAPGITPTISGSVDKVYDGTTAATGLTVSASGLYGDNIGVQGTTISYASRNAGQQALNMVSNYDVTNGGVRVYGYQFNGLNVSSGMISKAPLTISAVSDSKTYDGTVISTGTPTANLATGTVPGAVADTLVATQSFASRNAMGVNGSTLTVKPGYVINDGNGGNNYLVQPLVTAQGTINKAPLTIRAVTESKTYDGTLLSSGTPTANLVAGTVPGGVADTLAATQSFASRNAMGVNASTLNVNPGYVLNDGNGGNNYLVQPLLSAQGTINKAALTIRAVTDSRTYDGTTVSLGIPTANLVSGTVAGGSADTLLNASQSFMSRNAMGANGSSLSVNPGFVVNDGNGGNNYTAQSPLAATGTITPLASLAWRSGVSGNWSQASNWVGNILPDGGNVLAVTIPAGSSVTYDAGTTAANTTLNSLISSGVLTLDGGASSVLTVNNQLTTPQLIVTSGSLRGAGNLTVNSAFSQAGGSVIALTGNATAAITQGNGNLVAGSVSAPVVALTAQSGGISQSAPIITAALQTSSVTGTTLTNSGNRVSSFTAQNSGSGNITLVNGSALSLGGITNSNGGISVDNNGALTTSALDKVKATGGTVTLVAHSPLTIGSAGVTSTGDIALTAGATPGSGDDLTLTGLVEATGSGARIILVAGDNLLQNANLISNGGNVSANATTGSITMASGSSTATNGGSIGYAAPAGNISLTRLNAGSGPIGVSAGGNLSTTSGATGANLIGASAIIAAGGTAYLSTQVGMLDVNVGGAFRIVDAITGTVFTDQPAAPDTNVQPAVAQVTSAVVASTQAATQSTTQTTTPPAVEPKAESVAAPDGSLAGAAGASPLKLIAVGYTVGGTDGSFGGSSTENSGGGSAGASGSPPGDGKSADAKGGPTDGKKDDKKDDKSKGGSTQTKKDDGKSTTKKAASCT